MSDRWVSQSEAARLETEAGRPVNQSSISRFLVSNPDIPVQRGDRGQVKYVEYGALAAARGQSLPVQDKLIERTPAKAEAPPNRKRQLEERKLELDLGEREGELISRDAVRIAIETAGLAFSQGMERRRRSLATRLTGITDIRAVEIELKASDRALLGSLAEDLVKAAAGLVAEPVEDA